MSDAAITSVVTGVVTIVVTVIGFLTMWVKLKYGATTEKVEEVARKIDNNTALTKAGTDAATHNAKIAAKTASEAKDAATAMSKKLNGGVDAAISEAIAPVQKAIEDHAATDDKNLKEVNDKLYKLTEYVHERNHDILNALSAHSNKLHVVMEEVKKLNPGNGSSAT